MSTLIKKRVQYSVDEAISESAEYIIKKVGLTPASVFSMVMAEIAKTGRIPVSNQISDDDFNKSVILDLENFLITHIAADGKFKLQNSNYGNSPHNYYEQNDYEKKFPLIWDRLQKLKLANTNLKDIDNSDIFKYSPYKSLSPEQYEIVYAIIEHLAMQKEKNKKWKK